MKMTQKIFLYALCALIIAGCGTVKKSTESTVPSLPTQEEAELLMNDFIGATLPKAVFPVETETGPKVFSFTPLADQGVLRIAVLAPENGQWALAEEEDYSVYNEKGLRFAGFQDTTAALNLYQGRNPVLTFSTLLSEGDRAEYTVFVYNTNDNSLHDVNISGKLTSDGRIEGSSNKSFIDNPSLMENRWAIDRFNKNTKLVELGQDVIMTNQALEWWFSKNPKASSASKINFGGIPAESSLAQAYEKAKGKEKSGIYTVALFDHRGYTVIVAKKSNGEYVLAWAEPVCKNKNTDPLLNTIYFEKGSQLAMFYYHGNKTYKLHLNLANGSIYKS
ncbi:MAG: hypothetical protein J6Z27_03520 [Bacteroidales bacterium]|nr:hypothetical protein [Bacteroidales bacterium]